MAEKRFITKNGLQTQNINFVSPNNTYSILAEMLDSDTIAFSGNSGQLFSITDSLTGTIFSVNDISGIPSIEVLDDGTIRFAQYSGNVGIGKATPTAKLDMADTTLAGSGSLAGSVLNLTQTWNTSGTPTAIKLNVTDTNSGGNPLLIDLQANGSSRFDVTAKIAAAYIGQFSHNGLPRVRFSAQSSGAAIEIFAGSNNSFIGFGTIGSTVSRLYAEDASNGIIGQRNGVNPQTFRVYNTFTDISNYERGKIAWNSNVLQIGTEEAGTGLARALDLQTDGTTRLNISATGPVIRLGSDANGCVIFSFSGSTYSTPANGRNLGFFSYDNGLNSFGIAFGADSVAPASGSGSHVLFARTFAPTSGTSLYHFIDVQSTVNQTGGANGITRGIYVRPTLTAAADWRSIETSNNTGWSFYGAGTAPSYFGGNVGIGITSPSALFSVGASNNFTVDSSGNVNLVSPANIQVNRTNDVVGNNAINLANQFGLQITGTAGDFQINKRTGGVWSNTVTVLNTNGNVGIGTTSPSARLHVKGSGTTSATFGINLEDSAGTHVFRVRDDGGIHIGPTVGATSGAFISASDGADNIGTTTGSGLRYRSSLTISTTGADHYFRNYQGSRSHTSGNAHLMQCVGGYAPTSGTGVYNLMTLMPTVNQTGGATGITRGLYIEAVLTAADDYRAIDTNNGVWRLNDTYGAGSGSLARPALTINQTWNTTGIPTAFQVNVTDTASNASSLLMDLRVGGTSRVSVAKSGFTSITTNNNLTVMRLQNSANTANSGYEILVGSPGNYDGYLMVRRVGQATPGDFYLPNGGAPVFTAGVGVGDGNSFSSSSSQYIAYYSPYTPSGGHGGNTAEISFRNVSNPNPSIFEFVGYYNDGVSWNAIRNTLILRMANATDGRIGIGTRTPSGKLAIVDTVLSASGSLATSALDIAQTWNTTGTPTAIKLNVTNTASNASSLLMDLQVGGSSVFNINASTSQVRAVKNGGGAAFFFQDSSAANRTGGLGLSGPGTRVEFTMGAGITSGFGLINSGGWSTFAVTNGTTQSDNEVRIGSNGFNTTGFPSAVLLGHSFAPTSGTATFTFINVAATINQTGGANGITRGVYVNPTLTAAADWRSIETSNNSGYAVYAAGTASSYFNGRVGIGTASPGCLLDILGQTNVDATIFVKNSNVAAAALTTLALANSAGNYCSVYKKASSAAADPHAMVIDVDNTSSTLAAMIFASSGVERMRISSGGSVGIGTTSPGSALDVKGTLRLSGATSGYVGLAPAAAAGSTTYTLPSADGTNGQFLRTNGSGTLSWGTAGATAYTVYSPTTTTTISETSGEVVVLADATSGNLTVNLPTAVSNTAKITIKKIDSSANTVIIDPNSTQTVDGSATKTIEFQYTSVTLISNNANWFII